MELDANIIQLQSVLNNIKKNYGEFSSINCKEGNESQITKILKAVKEYLETCISKNINVQEILRFFIINTRFIDNELLNFKEYCHLVNVIPLLSKFMLANFIIELKLVSTYCSMMPSLPLNLNHQLLPEIMSILKHYDPESQLNVTYILLEAIILLLSTLNEKQDDDISKLHNVSVEMLKNLVGINPALIQHWKLLKLHKQIGHTFLLLLKLLRKCSLNTPSHVKIIDSIIRLITEIMKSITVDIFCGWAEIEVELGQQLQLVILNEAYLSIQYLKMYKPGENLINMLATIAVKPKTLNEIISEADITTIISNIAKSDNYQRLWFKALINTNVFQNNDAINCLKEWSHLCTKDEVIRLLSQCTIEKSSKFESLLIKCAKSLNTDELFDVLSFCFFNDTINNFKFEYIKDDLIALLNKVEKDNNDQKYLKEIYLLLLQDKELVLSTLYNSCLNKNGNQFKSIFKSIKDLVNIHDFSRIIFIKVFKNNLPTSQTLLCHKELLDMLLELYFPRQVVICDILVPQLDELLRLEDYETLLYELQICNSLTIEYKLCENTMSMIITLVKIVEKTRCNFFEFLNMKQQITQEAVNLLLLHSQGTLYPHFKDIFETLEFKNPLNKFYVTKLHKDQNCQLLKHVYPTVDVHNHTDTVLKLIKILPSCVTSEWILIGKELDSQFEYEKTLKLYQDMLILLCQLVNTQEKSEDNKNIKVGLIFCLQQYAIVIKKILVPKYVNLDEQVLLVKHICHLLTVVPKSIRKEEGRQFIGLLSKDALSSLKENQEFILSLVNIDEVSISQTLAKLMLS